MPYNNSEDSKFNKLVRIKENQLDWLKVNKKLAGCKTRAGFLDLIINDFKKYGFLKKHLNRNGGRQEKSGTKNSN